MEADRSFGLVWVLLLLLGITAATGREVCLGTDMKLALPSSLENHYEMLRLLYTGCQGIVEVQGYVLIAHVSVHSVPLDNLRIIRGSQLYNSSYALAVHNNIHHSLTELGLRELHLKSLTEILLGGVYIWENPLLCFPQKINWEDTVTKIENKLLHLQDIPKNCPRCSSACPSGGGCWGETNQDCQILTFVLCSSGCLRCKGPKPNDCCHVECAAGCTGPKDTDCLACRHFNDSGTCKDNCPPPSIYDPNTFQSKPNKDKKFNFGATCVKQCPHNYLAMEVACTMVCPKANKEVITVKPDGNETQKCEKCEGECPKVCYGLGMGSLQGVSVVDATNIGTFVGCKKIYGSLAFLSDSFKVNAATNSSGLQLSDLEKLKTIEEITGYLYIDAWPDYLLDLNVFENLKVIRGRMLYNNLLGDLVYVFNSSLSLCRGVFSLGVQSLQIESLGLRSLRSVSGGIVLIHNNSRLCYTSSLPWNALLHPTQGPNLISNNNQDQQTCVSDGASMYPLCAGCSLPGGRTSSPVCVMCELQSVTECVPQCKMSYRGEYWCPLDDRGCPIQKKTGAGTTVAITVGGVFLFLILLALLVFYLRRQKNHKRKETMRRILQEHEVRTLQCSTDQGLEEDGMPSGRELYSSVSTLGQSQYSTLPVRATANGMWPGTQYPSLVRSISHHSAGGQSDSVFVDGYVEDNGPPFSPCRYSKDPTIPNGIDGELETDGPISFLSHTLPRGAHTQPEYVNQDVPYERPSTLPRKVSERRFINGLYTGNSVENPEYLVPMRNISPISPAFDNPYYHDITAKAQAVARASINGGTTHRQPNGYMTPTAENPEYLGLAETWSGQTEYT
ncbi:hypothetical protein cypCar_00006103 [Cyprinus carpio]|nr:hypothetical protein cypCar_00006103 [Cyprinus carpio]